MSAMLFDPPSDDHLYAALLSRDPAFDGLAYVGVTSTGVFCRLTCPARKPRRENTMFFDTVGGAIGAGFRPCQRCRPLAQAGEREPLVARLVDLLDRDTDRRWSEQDLVARGFDPSTVRRAFRRHFGMTFLDMARLRRLGRGLDRLASGAEVVEAQLDAGFESASGFRAAFTRLVGHPPAGARGRDLLKADWIETPIGTMMAVADQQALHLLEFLDRSALPSELKSLQAATRSAIGIGRVPPIDQIERELAAFFAGTSARFATPLVRSGSAFTVRVWDALQAIPFGETRSYAAIARGIGQTSAVRAVARANGANRIAIVIPCHRVIGSDGTLTGYGGGLWRKRWLIEHEHRMARQGLTSGME
jgi:AraC family transcriptional regulator of adaptative response/methylated-DNA-[protein]-cysteine methyltransferase